jgi:hypothetical protein
MDTTAHRVFTMSREEAVEEELHQTGEGGGEKADVEAAAAAKEAMDPN